MVHRLPPPADETMTRRWPLSCQGPEVRGGGEPEALAWLQGILPVPILDRTLDFIPKLESIGHGTIEYALLWKITRHGMRPTWNSPGKPSTFWRKYHWISLFGFGQWGGEPRKKGASHAWSRKNGAIRFPDIIIFSSVQVKEKASCHVRRDSSNLKQLWMEIRKGQCWSSHCLPGFGCLSGELMQNHTECWR